MKQWRTIVVLLSALIFLWIALLLDRWDKADERLLWITLILVNITAIYAVFAGMQWDTMRQQWQVAKEALARTTDARLVIKDLTLNQTQDRVTIEIENAGKSYALAVKVHLEITSEIKMPAKGEGEFIEAFSTIPPDASRQILHDIDPHQLERPGFHVLVEYGCAFSDTKYILKSAGQMVMVDGTPRIVFSQLTQPQDQ